MGTTSLLLWIAGAILVIVGWLRARGPWSRYRALRDQAANEKRYADWRGGVRAGGTTGADVAMAMFRRQAQVGAGIAAAGFVLVFLGFFLG